MGAEWLFAVIVLGVNFSLWGTIGALRVAEAAWVQRASRRGTSSPRPHNVQSIMRSREPGRRNVAVLIAARNEELVLEQSLAAITQLVPRDNVFVVSDASVDRTVDIARARGVEVIETATNVGKAGALQQGIRSFDLVGRYEIVLFLDADTQIDERFFEAALPLFGDPGTVAVAGCTHTDWNPPSVSLIGKLLITHRARIYAITQRLIKLGQTWRRTNALYIVPGFASLYRTRVLPYMDINPPGLVIEDFNMTFEIYRHKLGRVDFTLDAWATTQDPDRFGDYLRQSKRWALGFWQSVRLHSFRACGLFEGMLVLLILELVVSSFLLLLLPGIVLIAALPAMFPGLLSVTEIATVVYEFDTYVDAELVLLAVLLPDYLLTVAVAVAERRLRYLVFAPFFILLRVVDAAIALYALPRAWVERSSGRWVSPRRRGRTESVPSSPGHGTERNSRAIG